LRSADFTTLRQLLQRVEHPDAGWPAALVVSGRRYLVPGL